MKRATVLYTGRVQGVGFRATVRQAARGFEVAGEVRNLTDGRVELVAEGSQTEIEAFLKDIAEGELGSFIAERPETWTEAQGLRGFRIVG